MNHVVTDRFGTGKFRFAHCTRTATGKISAVNTKGASPPTDITVEYSVNGTIYTITERVKLRRETIKLGSIPVGTRKVPVLGPIRVGAPVTVHYDPKTPETAYLCDNIAVATN